MQLIHMRLNHDVRPALGHEVLAVTIGNFDGCHRGHQSLIARTLELGRALSARSAALTFDPHPEFILRSEAPPQLTTAAQKTRAFCEQGLNFEIVQPFDRNFARIGSDEFYEKLLKQTLRAQAIVVGRGFHFGSGRTGDTDYLEAAGRTDGITVAALPPVLHQDEPISSTRIRHALAVAGEVELAAAMLGRPYLLEGEIRRGDQLGRQLGFPTANLEDVQQLVPAYGIYAGYAHLGKEPTVTQVASGAVPAVFSLGIRPTIAQAQPVLRIEAHLLAGTYGADALYEQRAGFYLTHRLREERRFAGMPELIAAIEGDIAQARRLLGLSSGLQALPCRQRQ